MFKKGESESGAVTIFLAMVLAVIFMFVAVFIDYARIGAMKVQTERLSHAAVRSVMSSYMPELQQRYGLFAHSGEQGDFIMSKVLNDSTKPIPHRDGLAIIPMQLDSSGLVFERELGRYDHFNQQIQEEMKYKAPIDFLYDAVTRFKPLSEDLKQAAHSVDVLRKLQKLYDKREKSLEQAIKKRREAAKTAEMIAKLVMDPPSSYFSDSPLGGNIRSLADGASRYSDYYAKYTEDEAREPRLRIHGAELSEYRMDLTGVLFRLGQARTEAESIHQQKIEEANDLIEEAKQLNEQMKQVIKDGEARAANQAYDKVGQANTPGKGVSSSGNVNGAELRKKTEELVRKDMEFADFINSQNQQLTDYTYTQQKVMAAESSLRNLSDGDSYQKRNAVLSANKHIQVYMDRYVKSSSSNVIDQSAEQIDDYRAADKERAKVDKQSQQKLNEAQNKIKLLVAAAGLEESTKQFNELKTYFNESISFNKTSSEESVSSQISDDPYDAGGDAMTNMDQMFGGMSGFIDVLSDELFQNEYAMHYFSSVDFSMLSGSKTNTSTLEPESFFLPESQELEYIIYGFHNPYGNITAAYGEVFTIRLAIRTMEGLVESSKLGNPLLILSKAILYGLEHALADMNSLADDGKVELSKYAKQISVTYRDHLRFFLLAHSNNEKKMSRMMALIRLNTDIDLLKSYTYASGQTGMRMKLWFLPGITKMLGTISGSANRVENGSVYITVQSDYSY
ncbi:hypothetical protein QPK24_05550 [Paenibacillus polygoni]|uniref:Flp pilus-assembly TadE/G-like n=1 Tax=Paenibacillus polygoni TaxID=3050112 RepID=A0ABY8XAE4_9BACL|nr:hypothetical protein [Paenibacillus polygoni]WIV20170.1 hypothetical protein QPK24_05550 [Paenibacillus polygoni]